MRVGDRLTQPISVLRGVRQGCPLSPTLLATCVEGILTCMRGVEVPLCVGMVYRGVAYADDIDTTLVAAGIDDMQHNMERLQHECAPRQLRLNPIKCGVSLISPSSSTSTLTCQCT